MGSLLIVSGPPGAGKSTVARLIVDQFERSVLVEGDAFFSFLASGAIDPWLPESHQQNEVVTDVAAQASGAFVRGGYETVYDGVVGPWFLAAFAISTGLDRLDFAVILPSLDACLERVRSRVAHGFSDPQAAASMHRQFAASDIDHRHVIADDAASPSDMVALIGDRRRHGLLGVQIR